ncbi:multiple sugar transport system permease protein [Paenibacillus sp. UNC496MF]|uniref:carbohydrate ABC transporter permease n=1 Tax=Paenibacillus sp. UNC496MF TaxID=1502753 RepID=UPI0008E9E6EE|nr:carbohydrate ABC transporter permease [Paenibacillus sp. UNC496MF]SFJ69616.1 multiple sugar transport system permease protein [Paenibacillus sp. UNC496MF]
MRDAAAKPLARETRRAANGRTTLRRWTDKTTHLLWGRQGNDGLLLKTVVYALLVIVGFVYVYPLLFMISQSFKSLEDLLDPTVGWIPRRLDWDNYVQAWHVLHYLKALGVSLLNSVLPAVAQTASCAIVGYGFAKYRFPGKPVLFALMLITFVVPKQVIMIPMFLLFKQYHMLETPLPFIVPGLFAQGLRGALFILIYVQFFRTIPVALEEAAAIDGAGAFKTFVRIILPISVPAIVVVYLFSMVWHWNETYLASLYLGNAMTTLPQELKTFNDAFKAMYTGGAKVTDVNEAIRMAGTLLIVLPLLALYLFAQKYFTQVVDKTGLTGE